MPPPPDRPSGAGTLTPPGTPPGPTATGSGRTNVATAGNFRPPVCGRVACRFCFRTVQRGVRSAKAGRLSCCRRGLEDVRCATPNDPLAGSAQYWLGETYYARGRYAEAASAFAEGYKSYPKGTKAADDLLKLGMSLARANQKQNACVALAQLDHDFPNPGSAIKEQRIAEKKRLGC